MVVYILHTQEFPMRRLNKLFLSGCGYTVLMLILFYLFAAVSNFTSTAIAPGQFILILTFGMIISTAELIYDCTRLKKVHKLLIHYFVLLVTFCVIFIASGNIAAQRPSAVFVAIILFTILYFAFTVLVHYARKAIKKADDKLDMKSSNKKISKKESYKPLYKEDN